MFFPDWIFCLSWDIQLKVKYSLAGKIVLLVFVVQLIATLLLGKFNLLLPGILLNGLFVVAYFFGSCIPVSRKTLMKGKGISKRNFYISYFVLFLSIAIFIDGALIMPNISAILDSEVALVRGVLLEAEVKYWQPRIIGYISVLQTMYAIYLGLKGYKGRVFFVHAIIISILNMVLVFGRGYLILNMFAISYYLIRSRLSRYYLAGMALVLTSLFVGIEFIRNSGGSFIDSINAFARYLVMPLVGSTYNLNYHIDVPYPCQNAFISKFISSCQGNLSQHIVSLASDDLTTNVYGAVGEWVASFGILVVPILGLFFGALTKVVESEKSPLLACISVYLFGMFSFMWFFSDPFTTNGFYFLLLLIWLCFKFTNILINNAGKKVLWY
jgi:oligosaccharide repeat unit polymerase